MVAANTGGDSEILLLLESVKLGDGSSLPQETIEAVLDAVRRKPTEEPTNHAVGLDETGLRLAISQEPDWRKRPALCALLASRSLDS